MNDLSNITTENSILTKLGGRKFLFMLVLLVVGIVIDLFTQRGLSDNFKEVMIYLAAIYIAGNGLGKVSDIFKTKKDVTTDIIQPVNDDTKDILRYQETILNAIQLNTKGLSELIGKFGGKQ